MTKRDLSQAEAALMIEKDAHTQVGYYYGPTLKGAQASERGSQPQLQNGRSKSKNDLLIIKIDPGL